MSVDRDLLKQTFGTIAKVYDTVRPGYPAAVGERILSLFAEPRALSGLEVGCGSGQATGLFVPAVAQLLAIDISPDLIALAQARFADFPNVRFALGAFETFEPNAVFDFVYSAQAFHWIPTSVGLPHAAQLLKSHGYLALFWNFFRYDADPTLVHIRECIIRHIPLFARYPEGNALEFDLFKTQWVDELEQSRLFKNVNAEIFESTKTYMFPEYLELVSSHSWFQTQPKTIQQALFAELLGSFGTTMPLLTFPVQTLLIHAASAKNN
jgi:SAM-dependent methyltransferase